LKSIKAFSKDFQELFNFIHDPLHIIVIIVLTLYFELQEIGLFMLFHG
jgi:hypothetical protein